jgi:PAS domain S-box-containing protein
MPGRGLEVVDVVEVSSAGEICGLSGALIDAAPVGLFLCNRDGSCVFANPEAARLAGGSVQDLLGSGWYDHLHPEDRERIAAARSRPIHPGTTGELECRLVAADGRARWVLGRVRALSNPDGEVRGFIGSIEDIDVHKRALAEREQVLALERAARLAAEQASRSKDDFLATLSHELRTPLNAIMGWADVLRGEDIGGATARDAIDAIVRNALAQAQLVEDLIDLTRIERGGLRLELGPCDLATVAAAALETVRPAARAKQLSLRLAVGSPRPMRGDRARLQQVIWNLLSNAVKFTPPGGWVEVSVGEHGGSVEVSVSDGGRGIAPDELPHLFRRFWSEPAGAPGGMAGLGLGLAIARELVEMHGGAIAAESAGLGRGATFVVRFPRSAPAEADAPGGDGDEPP